MSCYVQQRTATKGAVDVVPKQATESAETGIGWGLTNPLSVGGGGDGGSRVSKARKDLGDE